MRESKIETHLREQIEAIGGLCYKFVSPGRRNVPDRIVLMPPRKYRVQNPEIEFSNMLQPLANYVNKPDCGNLVSKLKCWILSKPWTILWRDCDAR